MESFHNKKQPRAKLAQGTGKSRDKIAKAAGIGRTLVKIAEVCEAAEAEPEKYGQFVDEMDRTGKVDGVYRKLRAELDAERRPMAELRKLLRTNRASFSFGLVAHRNRTQSSSMKFSTSGSSNRTQPR